MTHAVNRTLKDLSAREVLAVAPIIVMIFWIGLFPQAVPDRIEPTTKVCWRARKGRRTRWAGHHAGPQPRRRRAEPA